jgi:hypothetical protein
MAGRPEGQGPYVQCWALPPLRASLPSLGVAPPPLHKAGVASAAPVWEATEEENSGKLEDLPAQTRAAIHKLGGNADANAQK